jgi:hypothetical protein
MSQDDEIFRIYVSTSVAASPTGKWTFENPVQRSFGYRPSVLEYIRRKLKIEEITTQGKTIRVPVIDLADRAHKVVTRMTKGLLRTFYPAYDYSRDEFALNVFRPVAEEVEVVNNLAKKLRGRGSRGDGVFDFCHDIAPDDLGGAWILRFYSAACFVVVHQKPESEWPEDARKAGSQIE